MGELNCSCITSKLVSIFFMTARGCKSFTTGFDWLASPTFTSGEDKLCALVSRCLRLAHVVDQETFSSGFHSVLAGWNRSARRRNSTLGV